MQTPTHHFEGALNRILLEVEISCSLAEAVLRSHHGY